MNCGNPSSCICRYLSVEILQPQLPGIAGANPHAVGSKHQYPIDYWLGSGVFQHSSTGVQLKQFAPTLDNQVLGARNKATTYVLPSPGILWLSMDAIENNVPVASRKSKYRNVIRATHSSDL